MSKESKQGHLDEPDHPQITAEEMARFATEEACTEAQLPSADPIEVIAALSASEMGERQLGLLSAWIRDPQAWKSVQVAGREVGDERRYLNRTFERILRHLEKTPYDSWLLMRKIEEHGEEVLEYCWLPPEDASRRTTPLDTQEVIAEIYRHIMFPGLMPRLPHSEETAAAVRRIGGSFKDSPDQLEQMPGAARRIRELEQAYVRENTSILSPSVRTTRGSGIIGS